MKKLSGRPSVIVVILYLLICSFLAFADERAEKVDKLFSQWDRPDTPGCALAVIQNGRIIYKKGYGQANLEHSIPITPKSVFYVGSVSKQFVAFSVALLARQGKISLEDDIRRYIPEMPDYGTPITIRHLIHHTSGLRDYLALEEIAGVPFGFFHERDVLELIARQKALNFKPGESYLYSNSGYFLLSVIIQRASGRSLREFAEKNIFRPLGMKNSCFHDDYTRLIKNRASGYYPAGKGGFKNFISTFDCVGSGGLFTSVEDLFLWDQNFYHQKAGGREVIELMHTRGTLNNGRKLDYAFALVIRKYRGLKTVGHGGALGGYRAAFLRFPEQKFSIIILSNLSSFQPMVLARKVADIYLADKFKEEEAQAVKKKEKFIHLPAKKLREKKGSYIELKTGAVRRISLAKGKLTLEAYGQKFPLTAISESEFHFLQGPLKVIVRFERKEEGKPMLMYILAEGEKPQTYKAFKRIRLLPEELKEYEGSYYSDELQVTFRLALKKGKLHLVHRNAPRPPLQPTIRDWFSVRGWALSFLRGKEGRIIGFILNTSRVRNLCFEKRS